MTYTTEDAPVPVWDFVVTQVDGNTIRFHPSLNTKRLEIVSERFD